MRKAHLDFSLCCVDIKVEAIMLGWNALATKDVVLPQGRMPSVNLLKEKSRISLCSDMPVNPVNRAL